MLILQFQKQRYSVAVAEPRSTASNSRKTQKLIAMQRKISPREPFLRLFLNPPLILRYAVNIPAHENNQTHPRQSTKLWRKQIAIIANIHAWRRCDAAKHLRLMPHDGMARQRNPPSRSPRRMEGNLCRSARAAKSKCIVPSSLLALTAR